MPFGRIPTCFSYLGRSVASRLGGKASIPLCKSAQSSEGRPCLRTDIDDRVIILRAAQHLQSTQSPLSTLASEDRREANVSMYRRSLVVDE